MTVARTPGFESDLILIDTRQKEYLSSSSEIEYKNFMYFIRGHNTILYRKVESVAKAEDQLSEALKPIQLSKPAKQIIQIDLPEIADPFNLDANHPFHPDVACNAMERRRRLKERQKKASK